MIVKLAVASAAFIVLVCSAGASAVVGYRRGYVEGLGVAEQVVADRVVASVEIASAMRQNDPGFALRLTEMELDSHALLLRASRANVGFVTVGTSKPRPAEAIVLARRYRTAVPPEGSMRDDVTAMIHDERDDPAVRSTPALAKLIASGGARLR